jgi:hypothetical protein
MTFWDEDAFDLQDNLNADIWARSRGVQREVQPPDQLTHPGAEGGQQAMLEGPLSGKVAGVLPWVPDLVGSHWRDAESLLIVGSAYAGFIEGYSDRQGCLRLVDYVGATNLPAEDFQRHFIRQVVAPDRSYYALLQSLIEGQFASPSHVTLFDLCRASFVRRGNRPVGDKGGDSVTNTSPAYLVYVEHPTQREWLWQRVTDGEARRIIALGTIAEHGLLRLFSGQGMEVQATDGSAVWIPRSSEDRTWPRWYADRNHKLANWLPSHRWWTIRGKVRGAAREWALLPVYHPAARLPRVRIQYLERHANRSVSVGVQASSRAGWLHQEYQALQPLLRAMM